MMRFRVPFGVVTLTLILAATAAYAEPQTYNVVAESSSVTFQTSMIERIIGSTSDMHGTIVLDPAAPGAGARADITIATTSLKSDHAGRDEHMHSKTLHSEQYPRIAVTMTGATTESAQLADGGAADFEVTATVEIHGQPRSITFPAHVTREGDTLTIEGETSLLMTDYGIKPPRLLLLRVRNLTEIRFHIVANHTGS